MKWKDFSHCSKLYAFSRQCFNFNRLKCVDPQWILYQEKKECCWLLRSLTFARTRTGHFPPGCCTTARPALPKQSVAGVWSSNFDVSKNQQPRQARFRVFLLKRLILKGLKRAVWAYAIIIFTLCFYFVKLDQNFSLKISLTIWAWSNRVIVGFW